MQTIPATGRQVGYHLTSSNEEFVLTECFGDDCVQVFVDQEISLDASRTELRKMVGYLVENDTVVVASLHCLGYCFSDLQSVVTRILDKGCSVRVRDENLTFSASDQAGAQSMLQLLSAVVRAEQPMLKGLMAMKNATEISEEKGQNFEPNLKASADAIDSRRLIEMRKSGVSMSALQEEFNLSRGAINRITATS